jgi:hypothetical protein
MGGIRPGRIVCKCYGFSASIGEPPETHNYSLAKIIPFHQI